MISAENFFMIWTTADTSVLNLQRTCKGKCNEYLVDTYLISRLDMYEDKEHQMNSIRHEQIAVWMKFVFLLETFLFSATCVFGISSRRQFYVSYV